MQSLNIFAKRTDINSILQDVLSNPQLSTYETVINNPDWIIDNCEGNINLNLFEQVLCLTRKNSELLSLVYQLIDFAEPADISDDIFSIIMAFPCKQRNHLLVPLSHKSLSEKQLTTLCKSNQNFEPFYELAILYYTDKRHTVYDLKQLIKKFKWGKFRNQYGELLNEVLAHNTEDREKRELLITELSMIRMRRT